MVNPAAVGAAVSNYMGAHDGRDASGVDAMAFLLGS
jgi:hypothetical protein